MAKIFNARAQLLFCSLNLLFVDVLVAVLFVVCISSLNSEQCLTIDQFRYIKIQPKTINLNTRL